MTKANIGLICMLVLGLSACKKDHSSQTTISYTANGVSYSNSATNVPPPVQSWTAPPAPTNLGMLWLSPDSMSVFSSLAYGSAGNYSIASNISLTVQMSDTAVYMVKPGRYTYQIGALHTHFDSVNAELAGMVTFDQGTSQYYIYGILVSDTVVITSVNNYLISGTFEATLSTNWSSDSVVHITNGTFTNFDLGVAVTSQVAPGGLQ